MPNGKVKLEDLLVKLEKVEKDTQKPFNPIEHKDKTRSHIAKLFTWGYLLIVAAVLVGVPGYNLLAEQELDPQELLVTISSVVGTPFGFIVGYYFKGTDKDR